MIDFPKNRELVLERRLEAPRMAVWRCWTEPDLLMHWFTPPPWTTRSAELDVRAGGSTQVVMADPEGNEYPSNGVYLEVVPGERLVFTDAYSRAWDPSETPFMTAIISLADDSGGTHYRAVARHFTESDRRRHEEMGFHTGWSAAADQLEALAASLAERGD